MSRPIRYKQPDEVLTLTFDFGPKLPTGTTLSGSPTTVIDPAGITVSGTSVASPLVNVRVSGGTLGGTHKLTVRIGVTNGDVLELDVDVAVREAPTPIHPRALVSLETLQRAVIIEGAEEGPRLQVCLNIATDRVESHTGRSLKTRTYTTEYLYVKSDRVLGCEWLDVEFPITALAALEVGGAAQTIWMPGDAGSPEDKDVFVLEARDPKHGRDRIFRRAGWHEGVLVKRTYTAGYLVFDADLDPEMADPVLGKFSVPYDLQDAVILLAADEYYRRFRANWGTAALALQGQTVQYDPPQLFGMAMQRLNAYRRWG